MDILSGLQYGRDIAVAVRMPAGTRLANICHGIKPEFLQEYLNELCYKFNRRHFGDSLFDRLIIALISSVSRFKH